MSGYANELLFGLYPYIAISVFLVGSVLRFDAAQYTWRSGSSQLLRRHLLRVGSNLFHIGILLLFAGHFAGLLTPPAIYHAIGLTTAAKQMMAMAAGGVFGTLCFVGLSLLIYRRLFDVRIRNTSTAMDIVILLLIYAQLVLGLATIWASSHHPDGETMAALADWAQRIVTFRAGAAAAIAEVDVVYKLHLVLGLTVFLALCTFGARRCGISAAATRWCDGACRTGWEPERCRSPSTAS
jgi:nitrate reductase gamma subunit